MNALAGLMNPQALGMGVQQAFQQGRAERADMETRNALSALVTNPGDTNAMGTLARYNPQAAFAMQDRQRQIEAQQAEAQKRQLIGRAGQGDTDAQLQLWGVDPETAMKLDDRQRKIALEGYNAMGQYALQISQLPPEQRPQAWDQAIDQLAQMGFDGLSQYRGQYSEQSLMGIVSRAGEMQTLIGNTRPQSFNVGPGEGRYERDPVTGEITTIIEPNYGGQPAFSPAGGGQQPTAKITNEAAGAIMGRAKEAGMIMTQDYQALSAGLGARGKAAMDLWLQDNGIRVVKRTGTLPDGRKVVELADGTIEYAAN